MAPSLPFPVDPAARSLSLAVGARCWRLLRSTPIGSNDPNSHRHRIRRASPLPALDMAFPTAPPSDPTTPTTATAGSDDPDRRHRRIRRPRPPPPPSLPPPRPSSRPPSPPPSRHILSPASWIVAAVYSLIVLISLVAERCLHYLGKTLKKNQKPLYEALLKVKEGFTIGIEVDYVVPLLHIAILNSREKTIKFLSYKLSGKMFERMQSTCLLPT